MCGCRIGLGVDRYCLDVQFPTVGSSQLSDATVVGAVNEYSAVRMILTAISPRLATSRVLRASIVTVKGAVEGGEGDQRWMLVASVFNAAAP